MDPTPNPWKKPFKPPLKAHLWPNKETLAPIDPAKAVRNAVLESMVENWTKVGLAPAVWRSCPAMLERLPAIRLVVKLWEKLRPETGKNVAPTKADPKLKPRDFKVSLNDVPGRSSSMSRASSGPSRL